MVSFMVLALQGCNRREQELKYQSHGVIQTRQLRSCGYCMVVAGGMSEPPCVFCPHASRNEIFKHGFGGISH